MPNPRSGNGTRYTPCHDATPLATSQTPCGYVMRNGEVCGKPRQINLLTRRETCSCADHAIAMSERKAEARRIKKKAVSPAVKSAKS